MISVEELKRIKRKTNLYNVEKEYLQHIFLNAISKYSSNFTFKGGTCLRIVFELERASEDLDFNTNLQPKKIKEILSGLLKDFEHLNIPYEIYSEKIFQGNIRFEIRFKGPLCTGDKRTTNTIKIDFNKRDVMNKETNVVKKLFSDIPPFAIITMSREEILSEKLRALCMRGEPRDLYDVWVLLKLSINIDKKLLDKKLREDNIRKFTPNFPSKREYENDLKVLLRNTPNYEEVVSYVKDIIKKFT